MLRFLTALACLGIVLRFVYIATRPPRVPEGQGVATIEMSVWGMPWENDLYTKVYLPEFERLNPGIKVRFHHFEDYGNRILLSHAGGIAPDVIRQNVDFSMGWIRRGMNLPLNAYIDGSDGIDRADFIPMLWEGLAYEGETYGVPQDINILALFYNKDIFDKAGIAYPEATWTWERFHEVVKKLTIDEDKDGHPDIVGLDMAWGGWSFRPFVYQAGGKFWNEDGVTTAIDSPEATKALDFYRTLMTRYSLTRSNSQRGGLGPDKFFEAGKVALFIDGSWRTPSLKKNAPKLRFGVAPLPGGKERMSVSSSCFWAVSTQTRHPEAAWKLVKFLTSKEALTEYWQFLWVAPPARWSSLRSPEFRKVTGAEGKIPGIDSDEEFDEKCGWIPQVLENGWTSIEICNPYTDRLLLHLGEAVDRVLLEQADAGASLKEAKRKTDEQIAQSLQADEIGGKS